MVAGEELHSTFLPEIELVISGGLPLTPHATLESVDLALSIRKGIRKHENIVIFLDHFGVLPDG